MISPAPGALFVGACRRQALRVAPLLAVAGVLGGCLNLPVNGVSIETDLSKVAGCEFRDTIRPPRTQPGLRDPAGYDLYLDELRRRTRAVGGTHLYILNPSAGWGGAEAVGTAYRCVP